MKFNCCEKPEIMQDEAGALMITSQGIEDTRQLVYVCINCGKSFIQENVVTKEADGIPF